MHLVNSYVNKLVVGSNCGDMPKYTGEGVALHDLLVSLVGQRQVISHHFKSFFGKMCYDIIFRDDNVTSYCDAVMS